jgi:hypothetical protein
MASSTPVQLNRNVIRWSVVLYIVLLVPFTLLHEAGHVLVCSASGFDYSLWIDGTGGHTVCSGRPSNSVLYGAMGGMFGLLGSMAMIGCWAATKRTRQSAVLIVGLAYAVDQSAKLILEGFFTSVYASGATDLFLTVLQLASWIGLMIYFAKVRQFPAVMDRTGYNR